MSAIPRRSVLGALAALVLGVAGFFFWRNGQAGDGAGLSGVRNAGAAESKELLTAHPETILVDVRTPGEYAEGHLAKSRLLTLDTLEAQVAAALPDKNAPLLVYCRTGRRSAFAATILQRMGYTNVTNMTGGIVEWGRAGLPITKN